MSWYATGAVKGIRSGITRTEKLVLLILADYHNDETGQCNPGLERLAADCLLSTRRTSQTIASLERKGLVSTLHRRLNGGHYGSNWYQLNCVGAPSEVFSHGEQGDGAKSPTPPSELSKASHAKSPYLRTVREPKDIEPSPSPSERGTRKEIDPDFLAAMTMTFRGVDVEREYAKFRDYNSAKGRRLKDNRAGFRLWLRKAEEFAGERKQGKGGSGRGAIRSESDLDDWERYKAGQK